MTTSDAVLTLVNIAPGQVVQTDLSLNEFLDADPGEAPYLEYEGAGLIRRKMSPNTSHAQLVIHLGRLLLDWGDAPRHQRLYVYADLRTISGGLARLPDLAVYRTRPRQNERQQALVVADLSIEIISPGESQLQQHAKCRWYLEHGGKYAILLDPRTREITLFSTGTSKGEVTMRQVPTTESIELDDLARGLRLSGTMIFGVLDE